LFINRITHRLYEHLRPNLHHKVTPIVKTTNR
jgi:hypothetical protein